MRTIYHIKMSNESDVVRLLMIGIDFVMYTEYSPDNFKKVRDGLKETFNKFVDIDEIILVPGVKGVYYFEQRKFN